MPKQNTLKTAIKRKIEYITKININGSTAGTKRNDGIRAKEKPAHG